MRAVILAAGVGNRLGNTHSGPKSLLAFGGKSLLARHLDTLAALGVGHVAICVGHEADRIRGEVETLNASDRVSTILNPDYREGSVVSLWTVRRYLEAGGDVLVMDADVLYDAAVLARLVTTGVTNCFLLDRDFEAGEEPVKLCLNRGLPVEFRKRLDPGLVYDLAGESVGFFRFSEAMGQRLARRTEYYVDRGGRDQPYEEAIRDLLLETPDAFGYEDVTGMPWIEIDFPEDVARARDEILPRLAA
jgi:choline kinase